MIWAAMLGGCVIRGGTTGTGSHAEPTATGLPASPVVAELRPYFRELRTLRLTRGQDTLTFLLDTGGGHTLLTPEAARRVGCTPSGRSVAHRMTGEVVEFSWCPDVTLALAGHALHRGPIAVFDLASVLPAELPPLDGLLALPSFVGQALTIDVTADRLTLESEASASALRRRATPLQARLATGEDGGALTLFLAARASPLPLWLLLDNANLQGLLLAPHAAGQLPASAAAADQLTVPNFEVLGLPPVATPARVRALQYDGVLGATFFQCRALLIDLRSPVPDVSVSPSAKACQ